MNFGILFLGALLLNLFAFVTIKLRPKIFKVKIFNPMIWNFKLSILPLFILLANLFITLLFRWLGAYFDITFISIFGCIMFFVGLLIWMLFLPNSGYLITELNLTHRDEDEKEVPIWYDIVSVLSFALSGIVNTLANIATIQLSFMVIFDPKPSTASVYNTMLFVSAFGIILLIVTGIYLGRAIRFNSWDVLHPMSFFKKLKAYFSRQGNLEELILYIMINTIFFMIMYVVLGIPFYYTR